MPHKYHDALAQSPLYTLLEEAEQNVLRRAVRVEHYACRETLYHEGETVQYLYYLLAGSVKVYREGLEGYSRCFLAPVNNFFDLSAYFTIGQHTSTAEACSDALVLKVPVSVLETLLERLPSVNRLFLKLALEEMSTLWDRYKQLEGQTIRQRLATSLLYIVSLYGYAEDGQTLPLQLSRKDLSALSAMTASNVSRTLTSLVSERILSLEGKLIKVVNEPALRRLSI